MAKRVFGPSIPKTQHYPSEMRRQLWPLCCGASIMSGFKDVMKFPTVDDLKSAIIDTIENAIPDLQVFGYEEMTPKLTFLTLNHSQMASKKITDAIKAAGFVKFAEASPRGAPQGFYMRDTSKTFNSTAVKA